MKGQKCLDLEKMFGSGKNDFNCNDYYDYYDYNDYLDYNDYYDYCDY